MIKRILAGICDPQYTASVAHYACELAQRFSAEVTAISVTDVQRLRKVGSTMGAVGGAKDRVAERIEDNELAISRSLEIFTLRMEEANIPCRVVKEGGSPFEAMLHASRYHDLMVFGLRGLFEHGVIDEPPDELIQLVESGVRPILAAGPAYREINRILIGYSGSVESAKTIRNYAMLNLWPDAHVKVLHIGKRSGDGPMLLTDARNYLRAHNFSTEIEFIEGSPKYELLLHAHDWNADLIVVGNSAKSLLRRRFFGETALKAMRDSHLPLFLSQ